MNNGQKQAFPLTTDAERDTEMHEGLSKREYFAGLAMQGMLSDVEVQRWLQDDPRYNGTNFRNVVAINSVEFADALLAELDKQ